MSASKKLADYLTPEKRAEHARIRADVEAEFPDLKEKARKRHEHNMRQGTVPHIAVNVLRLERNRQGLSDEEMMARSGLDREALASMSGRDASPSIETMEAYAKALGKKLLMVLADEDAD